MITSRNILIGLAMCLVALFYVVPTKAQNSQPHAQGPVDLRGSLEGKWKLYDSKTSKEIDTWEFQADGKFLSTGDYWENKNGLYRTNEARSVLFIEINEKITEWSASIKEDVLALKEVTNGTKKSSATLSLRKVESDQ